MPFPVLLENWCGAGYSPSEFWEQTPASYGAALRGVSKAREMRHRYDLVVARTHAIWCRQEPKHIPTVSMLLKDQKQRPTPTDLKNNAKAWIAVLKVQQKGKANG